MFSNLNKPAFGTSTTTPSFGFGNTAAPNQAPFGQSQLFGKPNTTGFGTTAPLFGTNAPQPAPSLFGTPTNTFGAPAQPTGFGSTSLFGQQQNVPAGNTLFGTTTTSSFGQQNKPTGFGFGSTTTPLFGQQQSQPFQPSTSSGIFGTSNAFGSTAQMGTVIKFNAVTGSDTMAKSGITHSISTKHHCITCMKEYESKSLEELRWEDYQCNRKGPQQQQPGFGGFGTPASTAPQLFGGGSENKTAFGQMNTFAPSSSGFGLTSQPNQTSIFGKPSTGFGTQTTSSFGFNTTNTSFGNTATVKPFGAAPAQNVFGTATTQSTGFGTSLFGQPNTQTSTGGGFFSKPAQPAFSTQQNMFGFGQPQPAITTQTSFFQQPKPTTGFGTFGQTNLNTSTGFGQQTGLFSQPAQNPFNSFAKPAPPAFGQTIQPNFGLGTQQPTGTNLFGNTNKPLFGNTTQNNFFTAPTGSNFMMPQQQQVGLGTSTDSQLDFHTMVEKIYEPFPRYSFLDDLELSKPACHNTTNPVDLKEIIDKPTVPILPESDVKKHRVIHSLKSHTKSSKYAMMEDVPNGPTNTWKGKRLQLTKSTVEQQIDLLENTAATGQSRNNSTADSAWFNGDLSNRSATIASPEVDANKNKSLLDFSTQADQQGENVRRLYPSLTDLEKSRGDFVTSPISSTRIITRNLNNSSNLASPTQEKLDQEQDLVTSSQDESRNPRAVRFDEDSELQLTNISETEPTVIDTCGIKLERTEYYTLPPLHEISKFKNETGACIIKGFTVGRVGYGNIYFPDPIDVSNLDLDEIVHIRYREVIVYLDDNNKPPLGEGLNRPAQVTIDRIWPRDPESKQMIKDASEIIKNNFVERLAIISEKQNAQFIDYRPETGSWVFTVEHFSKYKYIDDADEEAASETEKSFQSLEIRKPDEAQQTDMAQDIQELPFEPIRRGLGGFHHTQHSQEESGSIIRSFKKPHHMPDSKSVVIMKSAFFDEESVSDDISSSELAVQHFDIPMVQDITLIQPQKPRIYKPKQYALRSIGQTVPMERSISILPNCIDMQVFRGRSFKVGWGRGLTLMTLPPTNGEMDEGSLFTSTVMCLEVNCVSEETALLNVENHMKVILNETVISVDAEGIPSCSINEGSKCLETLRLVTGSDDISFKEVWDLCLAFWGPCATTPTEHNDLFNEWLEAITAPTVASELEPIITHSKETSLKNIYTYLTGYQIDAASNLAMESGFPRLGVTIPGSVNITSRTLLYNQLHSWKETGVLKYIDHDLTKIYMLLGGIPVVGDINVCDSLDWKRSLALHYWYMCPPGISLIASLHAYKDAFQSLGYACRPSPSYYKLSDDSTNDVLYNIMLLFTSRGLPLYNVLNPASYSENPLDFRLSWFLLQIFTALKVGTISEQLYDYICVSFSLQLEHLGLWQWAIFVLLFIKNKEVKCIAVVGILDRNLDSSRINKNIRNEDFLVNDLKICPKWIHTVLAQKTAHINHLETFQHLILANDYGQAHVTAVNHLIPKFIKTCQLDLLTKLLKDLLPGRMIISQWNTQAGFILDFLEVYHKVINYKDELQDFECRNIKSALNSLCVRMKEFPRNSPHQSKALTKIGQFIAELITIVYCDLENIPKNKEIASDLIKALVMPYDYIHIELEKLANK